VGVHRIDGDRHGQLSPDDHVGEGGAERADDEEAAEETQLSRGTAYLGDQLVEGSPVGDLLAVVVGLFGGEPVGEGLAGDLAGVLVVGAVSDRRVGVAAAAGAGADGGWSVTSGTAPGCPHCWSATCPPPMPGCAWPRPGVRQDWALSFPSSPSGRPSGSDAPRPRSDVFASEIRDRIQR